MNSLDMVVQTVTLGEPLLTVRAGMGSQKFGVGLFQVQIEISLGCKLLLFRANETGVGSQEFIVFSKEFSVFFFHMQI